MITTTEKQFEILQTLVGAKATIFKYGEMGFAHSIKCTITKVYRKDYAQYSNCIHVEYVPKGKRSGYVWRILASYQEFMVYQGHVDLNTEMFVKTIPATNGGLEVRESLLSFSSEYLQRAKASTTATPLIIQESKETEEEPAAENFK